METKLERELRFLKIYAVTATLLGALFVLAAFTLQSRKPRFKEIDVERINSVEKDGQMRFPNGWVTLTSWRRPDYNRPKPERRKDP